MGHQIAIAMDTEDERAFLDMLRRSADIVLYRSWSPSADSIESFPPVGAASPFYLHNRAFDWKPKFERVQYTDRETGLAGSYFRLVTTHAPVLEYSRHPFSAARPQVSGRLYWAKLFVSQVHEIQYDLHAFEDWFGTAVRWVRKHGIRVAHGSTEPWCLPGARRRLQNEPQYSTASDRRRRRLSGGV